MPATSSSHEVTLPPFETGHGRKPACSRTCFSEFRLSPIPHVTSQRIELKSDKETKTTKPQKTQKDKDQIYKDEQTTREQKDKELRKRADNGPA